MFLFFDTETTGLPQRWNAPVTEVDNWPRLVQLAWIMCDDKGNIIEERSDIIKPEVKEPQPFLNCTPKFGHNFWRCSSFSFEVLFLCLTVIINCSNLSIQLKHTSKICFRKILIPTNI